MLSAYQTFEQNGHLERYRESVQDNEEPVIVPSRLLKYTVKVR